MKNKRADIYDLIESLTVEERKDLIRYLEDSIQEMEEKVPGLTYLEEQWREIERIVEEMEDTHYTDFHWQIDQIWYICEDLINNKKYFSGGA